MNRAVAAVCLALAPFAASAAIYKVQMPDGSILFTDSPPPGGRIIEERAAKPTPSLAPSRGASPANRSSASATAKPVPGQSSGTSEQARSERPVPKTLDAAVEEISAAEQELAAARRNLEAGKEPLPGERLGTAKGGSRLSPEYERRIAALEREVAQAEARLQRAYEARNALR